MLFSKEAHFMEKGGGVESIVWLHPVNLSCTEQSCKRTNTTVQTAFVRYIWGCFHWNLSWTFHYCLRKSLQLFNYGYNMSPLNTCSRFSGFALYISFRHNLNETHFSNMSWTHLFNASFPCRCVCEHKTCEALHFIRGTAVWTLTTYSLFLIIFCSAHEFSTSD